MAECTVESSIYLTGVFGVRLCFYKEVFTIHRELWEGFYTVYLFLSCGLLGIPGITHNIYSNNLVLKT